MRIPCRTFAAAGLTVILTVAAAAQSTEKPPSFEVASIKPAAPGARGMGMQRQGGGSVRMINVTLRLLITMAWDVRDYQVIGAPAWLDNQHFDIVAKSEAEIPNTAEGRTRILKMTQTLVVERFGLVFHREEKEMPVYALLTARNGPRLIVATPGTQPEMYGGRGTIDTKNSKPADLARMLSATLGRTVVDKTGLTGAYDFKLAWTPDFSESLGPKGMPQELQRETAQPAEGPSIFTAIQEQLGLKLESQKGLVEMFVVDRAHQPSEN
jgi:uncharacterized protein (TIGR03435 family)